MNPGRVRLVTMRVFGIDCGTEFTGYGVVEVEETRRGSKLNYVCAGAVKLSKNAVWRAVSKVAVNTRR